MVELTARVAIESLLRATDDDATPIIRRLARIQARAFLDNAPTPPTLSEDLREAIVRDLSEERRRYKEESPTWRAFGFCIDIAEKAALAQVKAS